MIGDSGSTQFHLAGGGDPFDELLRQVQQAAQGVYDVLGEMGRSRSGNVVYLAREIESGHLIALKLTRTSHTDEYALEVVRTLDATVPGLESSCPECKAVLPDWDRFCFHCGADLSAAAPTATPDEAAAMLDAVREATAGTYEILGQMGRSDGGGSVYFARDLTRAGKLVALRLRREDSGESGRDAFSIGETQVLRPLAQELGQTQVLGAMSPREEPSSAAPPPAPPPAEPARESMPEPAPARPARASFLARLPRTARWGVAVGVLVLALAAIALSGGGDDPPIPPPVVPDTLSGGGADSVSADSVLVVDPPPPPDTLDDPGQLDSATVRLAASIPAGAVFMVDGSRIRGTEVRLPAGRHQLAVVMSGREPISARVTLRPGQVFRWTPDLSQVAVNVPPPPPPRPPPPPPPPPPTCLRTFTRGEWQQAVSLCQAEADGGSREAQRMYGRMLELGNGIQQDAAQAASWYQKAGAAGDREAQVRLGYFFRTGRGVRRDERESARWFALAAEQGDPVAQLEYGVALEDGRGVRKSEAEALSWYQRAAEAGSREALRQLGRLHERGRGVPKSEAEAAGFYRQAGDKGDAEAMYLLGRLYKDGRGVEKSPALALEWFQKAAAAGHRDAAEEARKLERS